MKNCQESVIGVKMAKSKKTAASWIVGICVMAAASALTGCSADSTKTEVTGRSTAEATPSPKGQAGDQSTVQGAVAKWVTAIIEDDPKEACLVMATPATDGSPPKPNTAATCGSDTQEAKQTKQTLDSLHESFTPDQPKSPPTVKVAKVPVKDKKATVDGEQITVDGETLKGIVLSHSTGVKEDQVDVSVKASLLNGLWYVTDLGLSVG
jgi:hypothetical protein